MEIEDFSAIISTLVLAKELHDIDRFDIVEEQFYDSVCPDGYYHNILSAVSSIFYGFENDYSEESGIEFMSFEDDVISKYFVHAWEYGKLHDQHYSQNPYVAQAQGEIGRWLNNGTCVDWKLLAYIRTKKAAQQTRLLVCMYSCNCNAIEGVAYGLVKVYGWFAAKCAEFKAMENVPVESKDNAYTICAMTKPEPGLKLQEELAA